MGYCSIKIEKNQTDTPIMIKNFKKLFFIQNTKKVYDSVRFSVRFRKFSPPFFSNSAKKSRMKANANTLNALRDLTARIRKEPKPTLLAKDIRVKWFYSSNRSQMGSPVRLISFQ